MKNFPIIAAVAILTSGIFAGCGGPDRQEPPSERNRLVLGFFRSMEKKSAAQAVVQATKLQTMNSESTYLRNAIDMQTANIYLEKAQKKLDSGDADGAWRILQKSSDAHPFNQYLRRAADDATKLVRVEQSLKNFQNAHNSTEMTAQLQFFESLSKEYAKLPGYGEILQTLRENRNVRRSHERLDLRLAADAMISMIEVNSRAAAERRAAARAEKELLPAAGRTEK